MRVATSIGVFAALWGCCGTTLAGPISTETLLDELTDLERLTRLPEPAYTTRQFSSYDRTSTSPAKDGWFANKDHGHFIRTETRDGRAEYVMLEAQGPGAVVRIWCPNPTGVLRIYIDESEKPALEHSMQKFLSGEMKGVPEPLAGERGKGWNLYFPIPYARHCKITSDVPAIWYQVNYRTYAPDTAVTSFAMADLERLQDRIRNIASNLATPRMAVPPPASRMRRPFDVKLSPGAEEKVLEVHGSKAIVGFLTHILADDIDAAARGVLVRMAFDGHQTVEAPVGDFYGTAPGLAPYASLPMGVTQGSTPELWSHWWMPFARSAVISFVNLGEQPVQLNGGVSTVDYAWDQRSLHFHAGWRQEKNLPTRPFTDWTHLDFTGSGRLVGSYLHIQNPVRAWWGEGDEKIYVDGEPFPSHFGTGTEDYYGYGWCSTERFVHAFHNQPRSDGPGNYGNSSVSRFHIIDDIPFTQSIKFDMENWHWGENTYTHRATVTYWYARPGGKSFFKPITQTDVVLETMPVLEVYSVQGCQEGEQLQIVEVTGGATAIQEVMAGQEKFSADQHLWWTGNPKPGDKLTVIFESPESGPRKVEVNLTQASDYAIVQLYINGEKAGGPIDLFQEKVAPTGPIDLGTFNLSKGKTNQLTIEIVGANEKAAKRHMFGLDYILVR